MDQGTSLRTYLWLAGSLFIVAASLCFVLFLRLHLPWWSMVVGLGLLVAGIVAGLEMVVATPLERMARGAGRSRDGMAVPPPAPSGRHDAVEFRRLWRGMRMFQEQLTQLRHTQQGLEMQLALAQRRCRVLQAASHALRPDVAVAEVGPAMLRDLGQLLGVSELYLVPLRRHCKVPVMGMGAPPLWAEELRASGLGPWDAILEQDRPIAISLTDQAPEWRRNWVMTTLWVVPLTYHGRAQGLLLAVPGGGERTWTPDELGLLQGVVPILAASLHPPRWSEERRSDGKAPGREPGPATEDEVIRVPEAPKREDALPFGAPHALISRWAESGQSPLPVAHSEALLPPLPEVAASLADALLANSPRGLDASADVKDDESVEDGSHRRAGGETDELAGEIANPRQSDEGGGTQDVTANGTGRQEDAPPHQGVPFDDELLRRKQRRRQRQGA